MSSLRSIVTALAAVSVSYTSEAGGTVTPTAYDVSSLLPSMPGANLPVRLLGTTRGDSSANFMPITAGVTNGMVQHSVSELALIELVGLSRVADEWPDTMRYMDALLTALQANRSVYTRSEITGASSARGVFEYPAGSGENFFGCQTIINITEYQ
jgi:hypothetical protein